MKVCTQFYIDGAWREPSSQDTLDVINPATEQAVGRIALGKAADVDAAVTAAQRAFRTWSRSTPAERLQLLEQILAECHRRHNDLAAAITAEMGAPAGLSQAAQAASGAMHLQTAIDGLRTYPFRIQQGDTVIVREPVGVCGLITPWNWPVNQIACKVAPALAMGCTMVLKPSEIAPLSAYVWAEIMHAAGVPAGVFNLVNGTGDEVGVALSSHPGVDMMSFTGSTRAGIEVARNAAPTVKRVAQELGGKSAHIVLDDELLSSGVERGVRHVMQNSGQSCNAPTRMFVPSNRMDEAVEVAARTAGSITVGDPNGNFDMGPVASKAQFERVQRYIQIGKAEGAECVAGGEGLPEGISRGYFIRPTVFASVRNDMTIAREEIFGPVVSMLTYDDLESVVEMANDTEYGLAGYVSGKDPKTTWDIASRLRVGQVSVNGGGPDLTAPFGGFKKSGNGREWGVHAFAEFSEVKAVMGAAPAGAG